MDIDRVRAYLQVACSGLGFDIGEIWWSTNAEGSSALAAIEEQHDDDSSTALSSGKKMRFVQLYTSRSYEDRRSQLVTPADDEDSPNSFGENAEQVVPQKGKKHVLSPLLVDAISKTAQVVWAHTKKQEGLLGRSDMRLQTAVGMPVAVDGSGNMCVVVMFSPKNIQSTDDAMEYLQSISRSATSSSIPSLLPAFDPKHGLVSFPQHHETKERIPLLSSPNMTDGSVVTRFVSLDEAPIGSSALALPEVHSNHDLVHAPRDCFGIPMLPSVTMPEGNGAFGSSGSDAFDEASYGVWSTIMGNDGSGVDTGGLLEDFSVPDEHDIAPLSSASDSVVPVLAINKPTMEKERLDQLEEFASAFLDVSVFDFAEVWIPIGEMGDHLGQVTSVISSESKNNTSLQEFQREGEKVLVKYWSGAVGRAFSSGNPVWSANPEVFVDGGRSALFSKVKMATALAVPVFSGKSNTPSFVFCCYSFVPSGSVPFVLKFVQQALRLLWHGLDKVQPHESVGHELWKDVAPADLGEMAADVEMQQHFIIKKRPRASLEQDHTSMMSPEERSLTSGFQSMGVPSGTQTVRSIYTGQGGYSPTDGSRNNSYEDVSQAYPVQYEYPPIETIQSHLQHAVRSVGEMKPVHQHVSTNSQDSKRAHVVIERLDSNSALEHQSMSQEPQPFSSGVPQRNALSQPMPLPRGIVASKSAGSSSMAQPRPLPPNHMQQSQSEGSAHNATGPIPFMQPMTHSQQQVFQTQPAAYDQYQSQPVMYVQDQQQQVVYAQNQNPPQGPQVVMYGQSVQHGQASTPTPGYQHMSQAQMAPEPAYSVVNMQQQGPETIDYEPLAYSAKDPSDDPVSMDSPLPYAPSNNNNAPNGMPVGVGNGETAAMCLPAASTGSSNGKLCRIQGCHDPAVARRPYCIRHSGNRMCESEGCGKCAQGSTRFCIAHGGGRRCTFPGCDKGARDKFFCAAHGGGKRCKFDGCNKSAVGGSSLCTAHGGGRRCCVDGCDKSAQSSTKFCVKHGGGKKCCFEGCDKVARGRTQYCAAHGGGVRCKLEGCNRVAIGKLQLCRAHGGGSKPRRPKKNGLPPLELGPGMPVDRQGIPGFDDMKSV
eukprot:Nitzschia sp. Nitz4//scaffold102_size76354//42544//46142//NITZ4_005635-RA/size76354-processed-gene-0.41-mRNA-1//-1//CDS//3329532258//8737//frame0